MNFVQYQTLPSLSIEMTDFEVKYPTFKREFPIFDLDITNPNHPQFGTISGNLYDDLVDNAEVIKQPTPITKIGNFNVDQAVKELHSNVGTHLKTGKSKDPYKSGHMCARAVRMAMEAGGLSTEGRPNYGGRYGDFLLKHGWREVKGTPLKGDIAVTKPHGTHTGGHISMFDGEKWVSDYIQRDKFVYSTANDNNTTVYRYTA